LLNFGSKNKISNKEEIKSKYGEATQLKDISGGQLIKVTGKLEAERHFQSIQADWEAKYIQNKI